MGLVLTRRTGGQILLRVGEEEIVLTMVSIKQSQVRIMFDCDDSVLIKRIENGEVIEGKKKEEL